MVRAVVPREEIQLAWDCVASRADLNADVVACRDDLADAVEEGRWAHVATLLDRVGDDLPPTVGVNAIRVGDPAGLAPLHHAALQGTRTDVVVDLLARGAWRTQRTAAGDTARTIAVRHGHTELADLLRPQPLREIDDDLLLDLETYLRALVEVRTRPFGRPLRMPQLGPLLEHPRATLWASVPGMYGGFALRWADDAADDHDDAAGGAAVEVRSWSRVVGGSERTHRISGDGIAVVTRSLRSAPDRAAAGDRPRRPPRR